ncbi:MAG TPA: DUF1822 family protein [Crinalium sp.]|jgi:hypothetical protein
MTYSSVDSNLLFDSESLPIQSISLSAAQIERAIQLSQLATDEAAQWQTYLNTLGLLGFQDWLSERAPDLSIPFPIAAQLSGTTYTLEVGAFKLCLIVMGNLSDTVVSVPVEAIASSTQAAHLYVILEVQEEQEQMSVKACLRADRLTQQQQTHPLQPDSDGTYSLPLDWFESEPDNLLLYLRCLEPGTLPLGITASTPQTTVQPTPELSSTASPSPASSPSPLPSPSSQSPTTSLINAALWLRDQLDTVAQELSWVLLPPPVASAMRSAPTASADTTTDRFEQMVRELNRAGLDLPPHARGAFRDLQWGSITVRLYAIIWALPLADDQPEWTLLTVIGTPSGDRVPTGTRLQIQDQDQVLVERTATSTTQDAYLYGRVIGTWSEQFWVTVDMANGATITLPAFSFDPEA